MTEASIVLLIVFVMLYLAFLFWYGGRGKPLSQAEVESLQRKDFEKLAPRLA
jgi:uncharacterized protein YpmB